MIQLKRAYDPVEPGDGCRVLVDRLWPRGISKEDLQIDHWFKELAPSDELRKWFDHDPEKFEEFARRYKAELSDNSLDDLIELCQHNKTVTFIYAAKDEEHNNAVVLKTYLEE